MSRELLLLADRQNARAPRADQETRHPLRHRAADEQQMAPVGIRGRGDFADEDRSSGDRPAGGDALQGGPERVILQSAEDDRALPVRKGARRPGDEFGQGIDEARLDFDFGIGRRGVSARSGEAKTGPKPTRSERSARRAADGG